MPWYFWVGIAVYILAAGIVAGILSDLHIGPRRAFYLGATWPPQLVWLIVTEAFKCKPKLKGADKDWLGGSAELLHRKYPIAITSTRDGWKYRVGRHSGELVSSEHAYVRLEFCKEAAMEAYMNWQLKQTKDLEDS